MEVEEDKPVDKPERKVKKLPFSFKRKLKIGQASTDTVNLTNNEVIYLEKSECLFLILKLRYFNLQIIKN